MHATNPSERSMPESPVGTQENVSSNATTSPSDGARTRENRLSTAELANAAESRADVEDRQPVQRRPEDHAVRQALFEGDEGERFRGRWSDVQASFVDEPRKAVESADELVAEVMQRLAQQFANERQHLEQQWDRGGETDTEALRQALRRYRSFFDRLLAF